MIDFRLYRVALLPALAALVVVAFSLEPMPPPLTAELTPAGIDGKRAAATAREIAELGDSREPGTEADEAGADLVVERFEQIPSGIVTEQRFEAKVDGEDTELRNVIVTLPGESGLIVAVIAARDSAVGPGAASSGAATGGLLELATVLGNTDHASTIVLVSTAAGSAGAAGARELAESYPQRDALDAVVVLAQPAVEPSQPPYLLTGSTDAASTSIGLRRTVETAIAEHAGRQPQASESFAELARLALPSGLGEGSVLVDSGIDAVTITSAGEAPLDAGEDGPEDVSATSLEQFVNAALTAVVALDEAGVAPEHGPDAYVVFSGNLVPGWAMSLLALALLLPAAVVAVDAVARAARRREGVARTLGWAASRPLPLLAALIALYLLALVGVVPNPPFPFDPNAFAIGFGEVLALAFLAGIVAGGYLLIGLRRAPAGVGRGALWPALGLLACLATGLIWLINPFLALLLAPVPHLWLLGARERGLAAPLTGLALAIGLAPLMLAIAEVAGRLELGASAPWHLVLAITSGQLEPALAVALCLLAGSLLGLFARPRPRPPRPRREPDMAAEDGAAEASFGAVGADRNPDPVGAGPQSQTGDERSLNGRKTYGAKPRSSR